MSFPFDKKQFEAHVVPMMFLFFEKRKELLKEQVRLDLQAALSQKQFFVGNSSVMLTVSNFCPGNFASKIVGSTSFSKKTKLNGQNRKKKIPQAFMNSFKKGLQTLFLNAEKSEKRGKKLCCKFLQAKNEEIFQGYIC